MSTTSIRRPPEPGFGSRSASLLSERYNPHVLPLLLGTVDLTSLFLLNVYWVTNVTPLVAGGTASFTYWLIGGLLFFVPCSLALAQLAAFFPHEGSIYNWTHHALGPGWAFFVSICAWLPGVLSIANAAAFVLCLRAGSFLTNLGFAPASFPANILPLFVLTWLVGGIAYATYLARRAPERYERLGSHDGEESLAQASGRRPGMMQTVINAALAAHANAAEPERAQLDLATVGNVLGEGGYELVCRFGQVHAAADFQKWHVCLVGDLASLHPAHFLASLQEAITASLQLSAVR